MRKFISISMMIAGFVGADIATASAEWAIAVGQRGSSRYAYGFSYNQSSSGVARRVAMQNCRSNGGGCEVVAEGSGSCAAIAFGTEDNAYGWSEGDSERQAARAAERKCLQYTNGGSCEVRDSFCDN